MCRTLCSPLYAVSRGLAVGPSQEFVMRTQGASDLELEQLS